MFIHNFLVAKLLYNSICSSETDFHVHFIKLLAITLVRILYLNEHPVLLGQLVGNAKEHCSIRPCLNITVLRGRTLK